jgi:hypothetical protein
VIGLQAQPVRVHLIHAGHARQRIPLRSLQLHRHDEALLDEEAEQSLDERLDMVVLRHAPLARDLPTVVSPRSLSHCSTSSAFSVAVAPQLRAGRRSELRQVALLQLEVAVHASTS